MSSESHTGVLPFFLSWLADDHTFTWHAPSPAPETHADAASLATPAATPTVSDLQTELHSLISEGQDLFHHVETSGFDAGFRDEFKQFTMDIGQFVHDVVSFEFSHWSDWHLL